MILIRLVSSDNEGYAIFDNHFSTPINIKPYSKIALDTLALDLKPRTLTIKTGINDQIRYQVSTQGGKMGQTRNLTARTYTELDFDEFLTNLQNRLNGNCLYYNGSNTVNKTIGLEWFVSRHSPSNDGKLVIGYNIAPFTDYFQDHYNAEDFTSPNDVWFSGTEGTSNLVKNPLVDTEYHIITKNATVVDEETYYIQNTLPMCDGCPVFRVGKMGLIDDPTVPLEKNGFMISLNDETGTLIFGIRANREASVYQTTVDGVLFNNVQYEGVDVDVKYADMTANSDVVEIIFNAGNIMYGIYRENEVGILTNTSLQVDYNKLYYGRISITGNSSQCSVSLVNYSLSINTSEGYESDPASYETGLDPNTMVSIDHNKNLLNIPPLTATTPPMPNFKETENYFYLTNDIMNFLGFSQTRYPYSGSELSIAPRYISDGVLEIASGSDNFIVLCDNIKLDSFDGNGNNNGSKKSILSLIPDDDSNSTTLYNSNERIFLNIDNKNPINLNRVSISIVDDNYQPIRLKNKSSLSILIKEENE